MPKIYWLASYPKSGNTWTRILLAHCRNGEGTAVDINQLGKAGLSGAFARVLFDTHCALKSSTLPPHIADCLRPLLYRRMAAKAGSDLTLKVHDAWRLTDLGEAVFPAEVTGGVVYLLRNVLDVAPSLASHYNLDIEDAVDQLCDPCFGWRLTQETLTPWLRQPMGCWSSHVQSWLDHAGLPIHLVRYEDLLADTLAALTRIVATLGWNIPDETLAHAVEQSHFSRLKAREAASGFRENPKHARAQFFRRGQAGAWREEVPAPLVRRLIDVHGDTMRRFGYLNAAGYPVE